MRRLSFYKILVLVLSIVLIHTSHGTVAAYELFAVGDGGSSYHYDGNGWHSISDDNSINYSSLWVFSETDIYTVSTNSKVYHYDGVSWDMIYEVPGEAVLTLIWAASPSQIFVAGRWGVVYYYDGDTWEDVSIGLGNDFSESIRSIWGSSIDDVYAACEEGGYHYVDGHGWNKVGWPAGYNERKWNAVWGSGEDDVFFISDADDRFYADETIALRLNGSGWSPMEIPEEKLYDEIFDMWGIPGEVVYAVGFEGTMLRYDYPAQAQGEKEEWIDRSFEGCGRNFISVCGTSESEIYVIGAQVGWNSRLIAYRDAAWDYVDFLPNVFPDIFALPGGPVFITGFDSEFGHIEEDEYIRWTPVIEGNLKDVWAAAPDNVYAVSDAGNVYGDYGNIFNYNGTSWSKVASMPFSGGFRGIWGSSENDIYAVGQDVYHYDGMSWELFSEEYITDVWGNSSTDVYFSGMYGDVYHYDGMELTLIRSSNSENDYLYGVWAYDENNICAVGCIIGYDPFWGDIYCDMINHYDGLEWSWYSFYSVPSPNYYEAAWGTAADNIYATGCGYTVRYDGADWNYLTQAFNGTDIWGSGPDDIYFATVEGVMHYDGGSFNSVLSVDIRLNGIWGVGDALTPADTPRPKQALSQNYPNPFNPSTTISFSLRAKGTVSLSVYDVAGRLVHVLIDGVAEAGPHKVNWDGRDKDGLTVASGVYFYRLQAGEFTETRKMVLLR